MKFTSFDRWYLGLSVPAVAVGAAYLWPGVLTWPKLGLLITTQITWLAVLTLIHAFKVFGLRGALVFSSLAIGVSWLVESNLLRAAVFGTDYDYASFLGPLLPGGVPVTIPLMWFGLAYLAFLIANCVLESAGTIRQTMLCGYLMCTFDLLLDPIATGTGTFVWHEPGAYYTTPLQNFAGWFGVGAMTAGGYLLIQRGSQMLPVRSESTSHREIAVILGLAAFVLPMLLAIFIGRPGAAAAFFAALLPVFICWNLRWLHSKAASPVLSIETSAG